MRGGKFCRLIPVAFALLLGMGSSLNAQDRDAGLWTSLTVQTKVAKRLTADLSQEFRFNENISELGTWFTDAGLEYRVAKHFQAALNYRFMLKRQMEDYYSRRHRLYLDLKFDQKFKPVVLQFRTRLQDEYADIGRSDSWREASWYMRNKLTAGLDLDKKYAPYLSLELFTPLFEKNAAAFDNLRAAAGLEYSLTKRQKLDVFYMIQKELNVSQSETDFIIGTGYSIRF
jgi:hypothetical protein